ncbi:MAG TPA: tetratricopeptide repeat protein [Gemmataceae bacterium]|jgi:tetratricopeptide (TPR) repeat protein
MRRTLLSLAILMGGLTQAAPLRAGVYNLNEPRKYPSDYVQVNSLDPVKQVLLHLGELRAVDDRTVNPQFPPGPDSLRVAYENQLASLQERKRAGTLSPTDRVNLGACLLRLGRFNAAREALEESLRAVPRDHPARFLLLLNLASAYQEDETLLQRAIDTQRQALRAWPDLWPGWNRWERSWYHRAEEYALMVMQLRQREAIRNQGRPAAEFPRFYELFPKVQFVGRDGEYEAGGIAFEQVNQLPADAEMIVLQLLLGRPLDNRLFWLYGELLNVRGQIEWAFSVLDALDKFGWANRDLRRHHRILRDALPAYEQLFVDPSQSGENQRLQAQLLWALAPRGALLPPGIGLAANEVGGVAAGAFTGKQMDNFPVQAPLPPMAQSADALPDWRHLTVSFLTGIVVAVLAVLQWQQWRRRSTNGHRLSALGRPPKTTADSR